MDIRTLGTCLLYTSVAEGSNGTTQTVWDLVLELAYNSATGQFAPLGTIMGQDGLTNTGISAIALDLSLIHI